MQASRPGRSDEAAARQPRACARQDARGARARAWAWWAGLVAVFAALAPLANRPVAFLALPLLLWAAFRFGPRGAAGAGALISGIAVWGVLSGVAPFVGASPNESLLLQAFLASVAVTSLALAAALSERRRSQESLARTAAIVDSSQDAIVGKTLDGTIVSWNAGAEKLYGYSAAEAVGANVSMLVPPGEPDETSRILEKIRRGERVEHYETVRSRRGGGKVVVSLSVSPIRDARGAIVGASAIARDVTERKRAERRLATQFAVTRVLAEGTTLREAAPRLLQAVCEALGWDAGELWRAEAGALRCEAVWPAAHARAGTGEREAAFPPGGHLAGRVWESGRGLWIDDLAADPRQLQAGAAAGTGLRAAMAEPVRSGGEAVGVLAFYAGEARGAEPELVRTLADIASRTGQFLERERALTRLRRLEQAVERLELGVTITDMAGRILYTNPAEAALHGYRVEELIGRHVSVFMPASWQPAPGRPSEIRSWRRETVNIRKDGTLFPAQLLSDAVTDGEGAPIGIVTCCEEITERKLAEERIAFQAYHDPLTGLPNRACLGDRVQLALAQARRSGGGLAVMFLDLDRFKAVNDSLGHAAGDRLLQEVAARLRRCVREADTVARVGGDEFVLLLPGVRQAEAAARIAGQLLDRLAAPFGIDGHELRVTASVGIALFPRDGADEGALLGNADNAMYRAKEQGRNGYRLCEPEAPEEGSEGPLAASQG